MQATRELNRAGQSLWLDNITRELLSSGTLKRYIDELSITGLTSNPTIFDHAMKHGSAYDEDIRQLAQKGLADEKLFFELALEDLTRAADLFRPVHERTAGVDGWVSLEVSPRLAYDTQSTLAEARDLHARAARPNLFIKIPGTKEGLPAIESAIFAGVPINVTLLFSPEQYVAAAEAWLRGIERRIEAGLSPDVASVASIFLSRWDVATADKVPQALRNRLGLAIGRRAYRAYCELLDIARAGYGCSTSGHDRSGSSLRARGRKTRRLRMSSTSKVSLRRSPSTRCRRTHSRRSPSTARWARRSAPMAVTARRCSRSSLRREWISQRSPRSCSRMARRPSSAPGIA